MSGAGDSTTRVMGHLELMAGFSRTGTQRAGEVATIGARVNEAMGAYNQSVDPDYRIAGDGEPVLALGVGLERIDSFAGDIAERLRSADTLKVTFEMATAAAAARFTITANLDRTASDLALAQLTSSFDSLDSIRGGKEDGLVSVEDLKWAAEHATDPQTRAAAVWLLAHRAVVSALDIAAQNVATANGDNKISRSDVQAYGERQRAYRVMVDNFAAFDAARTGKTDGKVSQADLLRMAYPPYSAELRDAARVLASDPRGLNQYTSFGDQIAGVYDLDSVAKSYGERRLPLPAKPRDPITGAVCSAAGFYSLLGWADLVAAAAGGDGGGVLAAASSTVGTTATEAVYSNAVKVISAEIPGATPANAAKLVKLKVVSGAVAKVAGPGLGVAVVATAIDSVCRVTDPSRRNWGRVATIAQLAPPTGTVPAPMPGTTSTTTSTSTSTTTPTKPTLTPTGSAANAGSPDTDESADADVSPVPTGTTSTVPDGLLTSGSTPIPPFTTRPRPVSDGLLTSGSTPIPPFTTRPRPVPASG